MANKVNDSDIIKIRRIKEKGIVLRYSYRLAQHQQLAALKSLIKKITLKIHSLIMEVSKFEFRVKRFTRSNDLYQEKN